MRRFVTLVVSVLVLVLTSSQPVLAQEPTMLHPQLDVRTVVDGLVTPSSIAFLGRNELLVIEKNTGKVMRVLDGEFRTHCSTSPSTSPPSADCWASPSIRISRTTPRLPLLDLPQHGPLGRPVYP